MSFHTAHFVFHEIFRSLVVGIIRLRIQAGNILFCDVGIECTLCLEIVLIIFLRQQPYPIVHPPEHGTVDPFTVVNRILIVVQVCGQGGIIVERIQMNVRMLQNQFNDILFCFQLPVKSSFIGDAVPSRNAVW